MNIEHSIFTVSDMTCSHCVGIVTKALNAAFPGAAVEVDLASHKVRVDGNAAVAAEAIREAGYTPEPV